MITFLLPQVLIPLSSIKLGRFVTSIDNPHQDFHDPSYYSTLHPLISVRSSYGGRGHESRTSSFTSALTSLLSAGFSRRSGSNITIETSLVQTYMLPNSTQWFEEAISLEETRRWVEKCIDQGDDLYFVVGFHTIMDAQIIHEAANRNERTRQVGLPVGLALNAAGIIAPLGGLADPQLGASSGSSQGVVQQFEAPGEQVCGFQYRKVCHRWLSSKNIDNASLAKTSHWSVGDRWRDEEEGIEDILQVEIVNLDRPEGEWDEQLVDDEVLLIRLS
ncbi:MAG: hypothetical protein GOMPHAMPRED_005961 [Gomphillus americanus]|uniref:Uncharacterized protein n=1 Tax=Gomphillus americanus TaxID=1940652 RepID=A0A8H3IXW9_9LECA|nr:MAG: hypothetical protein GOMPHAMPRED_005961 [Gomphillus americanus]